MAEDFDVIVVGTGSAASAAAFGCRRARCARAWGVDRLVFIGAPADPLTWVERFDPAVNRPGVASLPAKLGRGGCPLLGSSTGGSRGILTL